MLSHLVLQKLLLGPRTGYQLCSEMERETGKRPSYGSVYPLLERMAAAGDVSIKEDGRRKVYSLTAKGKGGAQKAATQRAAFLDEESSRIKKLMTLMEMDPKPMLALLERARKGEAPLGRITGAMFTFRDQIFQMAADGRAEKNAAKINKMLVTMTKQLERMQ